MFTEFSGEIATKFTFQYTQQGVVWVIPYYAYVNAGASLAAKMNSVRSLPDSDVPFEFGFALKLTPELTIGGGAGVKGAISGGLYGKGSMPMEVNFSNKHTSGALSGEVGVEAELFCFKGKKEILKGKITHLVSILATIDPSHKLMPTGSNGWKKRAEKRIQC